MKLTDEQDDEIYDEINQTIHALVFLSHQCLDGRDGVADADTIREELESIEGRLKRIREICGLSNSEPS